MDNPYILDCRKLEVYRVTLEFVAHARLVIKSIPKGNSDLSNQFKRASSSILLNTAEAAGKTGKSDKQRFYSIARGSAMECAAILDLLLLLELVQPKDVAKLNDLLERIVAMLSKLCWSNFGHRESAGARASAG